MLLASVKEIREALGFDDMSDITFALTEALDAAEPILASTLNTEFAAGAFSDVFYVGEPGFQSGPAVATEFRLRRGFVTELTAISVSNDVADFSSSVLTPNVTLDADRGVLKDLGTAFDRHFVKVTYGAGFPAADNDPGSYDLTVVPKWLQQCAKLQAQILVADNPSLTSAQIKLDASMLGRQLQTQIAGKLRYAPCALLPL